MQKTNRASDLVEVARAIEAGRESVALELAEQLLPWTPSTARRGGISRVRALRIFARDRFVDRYSGSRLVFPGALIALGVLLPDAFPMSPTWKVSESHEVFWELWPVIDHVIPITRHGTNEDANLVTTSAVNNVAKGTALVEELGWQLTAEPDASESWDGMMSWFQWAVAEKPQILANSQLAAWAAAARRSAAG